MGMFDWVDYEQKCPRCGRIINDFQTKELDCNLDLVSPSLVEYFWNECVCGVRVSYSYNPPKVEPPPEKQNYLRDGVRGIDFEIAKYKSGYIIVNDEADRMVDNLLYGDKEIAILARDLDDNLKGCHVAPATVYWYQDILEEENE